jgi:taurine dioxygenase
MTTTVLDIAPSGAALGATVHGLDLHQPIGEDHIRAIYTALVEHQVLVFPQQSLSAEDQISFGAAFGHLQMHAALDALADHPEVVVFDTHQRAATAEWWHTDVTCAPEPPMGSILQMVIAPPVGGATHWASMTAAYDALDVDTQRRLEGLTALHRSWWQPVQESVHPVVRVHPDSGRKGIFVNGIFTKEILGIDPAEGAELLRFLIDHATRDEFTVHHKWRAGDIAFWDNRCTQHRVDNDFGAERRRGHRVTIDGDVPV